MSGSSFDIWPAHERGIRKRRGSSGKLYCANGCHSRGSLAAFVLISLDAADHITDQGFGKALGHQLPHTQPLFKVPF